MLRQPQPPPATNSKLRGTTEEGANAMLLAKKVFKIPEMNGRDTIVDSIRKQMPGTVFAGPLIAHLNKMGRKGLDKYDDLEIVLQEYNVTLRFQCNTRTDGEAMRYTIDRLASEPNEAFRGNSWADKLKFW